MIKYRNLDPSLQQIINAAGGLPDSGDNFYVCKSSLPAYNWLGGRIPGDRLFTTLVAANDAMTANSGQKCFAVEGHTEAISAEVALDTANVEFIGLGYGLRRPTLTHDTTAQNTISLDAANIRFAGFNFGVPGFDAVTADIDVVGAGCSIESIHSMGSTTAKNKVAYITLTATAHDTTISNLLTYNDTVEMVGGIVLEGVAERVKVHGARMYDSIGMTNGAINDAATALQLELLDCIFENAKADTVVAEFGNNTTGVANNCRFSGRHTTIQSNVTPGTGMNFFECYGVEEAAKNGILMPVADAE